MIEITESTVILTLNYEYDKAICVKQTIRQTQQSYDTHL